MRLNSHLHPNRKRLAAWAEGGESDLDRHVENCLRCAARIESLDEAPDRDLRSALRHVLAAPEDLNPRLREGIVRKLDGRGDMSLIGDLLGLPYQTAKIISQGTDLDG